jgi:iron(III) transport system substrate-binding protein
MGARRALLAAICLAAAVLLAKGAVAQEGWEAVIQAAKKEGKVVFYTSRVGSTTHVEISKAFEKKYGIKVQILELRANELREKIRTEQSAGRFVADVTQNGVITIGAQLRDGALQPHGGIPNAKNLVAPFVADDTRVPVFVMSYGLLINTRLVKPGDEPKSWKDVLDPKWKGKILADDMRKFGGGNIIFQVLYQKFGQKFVEDLAKQAPVFSRDIGNDGRRIGRGEYALYLPQLYNYYWELKGLPVKFIVPKEGSSYAPFQLAMMKNAPHPNAARLLMHHFLEVESQVVYGNDGNTPVVKGAAELTKAEVRPFSEVELLGTADPDQTDAMLRKAEEMFKP